MSGRQRSPQPEIPARAPLYLPTASGSTWAKCGPTTAISVERAGVLLLARPLGSRPARPDPIAKLIFPLGPTGPEVWLSRVDGLASTLVLLLAADS